MDAGRLSICGEESFGTGSDHIREKDGVWAVVGEQTFVIISPKIKYHTAWLNIIAAANKDSKSLIGIREILNEHYQKYGRSFFSRYDYEEVPSEGAQQMVKHLDSLIDSSSSFSGKSYTSSSGTEFKVASAFNFDYTDPIDGSVSRRQGQTITFSDGSRVVWRLSGTGSQGATVRMYVERYVSKDAGAAELARPTAEGLQALIEVALQISNLTQYLGREKPTVITVRKTFLLFIRF
jgi:phosphoglucomutase